MNDQIQARFTRLEAALDTLIDSITTYNPSPAAATNLVNINNDLNKDLEILSQHQTNVLTLSHLRSTTLQLDTQIKNTIALLSSTRKELLSAGPPAAPPPLTLDINRTPTSNKIIDATTLLQTAQRLAGHTHPPRPTYPLPLPDHKTQPDSAHQSPNPQTPDPSANANDNVAVDEGGEGKKKDIAPTLLTAQDLYNIDPMYHAAQSFTPWPSAEMIRSGLLHRLQSVTENGGDVDAALSSLAALTGGNEPRQNGGDGTGEGAVDIDGQEETGVMGARHQQQYKGNEESERRKREYEERKRKERDEFAEFELYDPDADAEG